MNTKTKILNLASLKKKLLRHKREGKTIAFTNGCFDLLHYGHVSYLESAKKENRILVVGLNSDASIRLIKDPTRPILPQKERAAILAALSCVDYVTIFAEATPRNLIASLKPDILIKGADWKGNEIAGANEVKANGGKVEFIKYIAGLSTTNIIKTILKQCEKESTSGSCCGF